MTVKYTNRKRNRMASIFGLLHCVTGGSNQGHSKIHYLLTLGLKDKIKGAVNLYPTRSTQSPLNLQ